MRALDTLVTDRTQSDVDRVFALKEKILSQGLDALTAEESGEYFAGMKGAYNVHDLNRVGQACAELYGLFSEAGYALPGFTEPKTDWAMGEPATASQMAAYLANVAAFRSAAGLDNEIPNSMARLSFEGANSIEKLLSDADGFIASVMRDWMYSGEIEAGGF